MTQQIEAEIRPAWSARKIETITRKDINKVIDGMIDRGVAVGANRVLALVRIFLNWCVARGVIDDSPVRGMRLPSKELPRDRVLSDDEVRWLWHACDGAGAFGTCARLLLLTGQRRMEVAAMERSELQLEVEPPLWVIPAARTKNGREHVVPLTPRAIALVKSVPRIGKSRLVFTTDGERVSSAWSKSKRNLDDLMLGRAKLEAEGRGLDPDDVQIASWTLHDLRRTCASGLARLREPPHVIEALLNHVTGQISRLARVYNLYSYAGEKRQALEVWEAEVGRIAAIGAGGNVVVLRAGR